MEKLIKTRHLETKISIECDNKMYVTRRVHSANNGYYHIPSLYKYLREHGISDSWGYCSRQPIDTISTVMPLGADIEREIDRALGEHKGTAIALEAELEALVARHITEADIQARIDMAVSQAVTAERSRISAALEGLPRRIGKRTFLALLA